MRWSPMLLSLLVATAASAQATRAPLPCRRVGEARVETNVVDAGPQGEPLCVSTFYSVG